MSEGVAREAARPEQGSQRRLRALVRGFVQGVGFRWFVRSEANRLGLGGWVCNRADGSVEVVAEGPQETLEVLAERLWSGPAGAVVDDVEVAWSGGTGAFSRFEIRSLSHPGD
jgi:acylphosphatase